MNKEYAPTVLRLMLGLIMLLPGINKLMGPDMIIGMLGKLGFPAAAFFGWVLIFSEIGFGLAVLLGYKLEYTVWPLVVILLVATFTVHIPAMADNPMGMINVMWHFVGIVGYVSLFLSGPGALAVGQKD